MALSRKRVGKGMGSFDFENLVNLDAYHDLDPMSELTESDVKEYATMVEEGDTNDDLKDFLLCLLNKISSNIKSLGKRRREEEEEEENNIGCRELESDEELDKDLNYKAFLENLRYHEKSFVVKNEVECDYKTKLRSARKKYNGPSNGSQSTYVSKEAENLSQRKSREKVESDNLIPDEIVEDPDYAAFLRGSKIVGDQPVYGDGHNTNDGESGPKREGQDDIDEWAPYVKILDRATFCKEGNSNSSVEDATDGSKIKSEFRRQLIAVLRKPYDEVEYTRLYKKIDLRKMEERHLELRNGRERSLEIDKIGKSLLDHHSDLREQLSPLCDDESKRSNLLRGFFFWLKKVSHSDSFCPWKDPECLAIVQNL